MTLSIHSFLDNTKANVLQCVQQSIREFLISQRIFCSVNRSAYLALFKPTNM